MTLLTSNMWVFSLHQPILQFSADTNYVSSNSVQFWHYRVSADPSGEGLSPPRRPPLQTPAARPGLLDVRPAGCESEIPATPPRVPWLARTAHRTQKSTSLTVHSFLQRVQLNSQMKRHTGVSPAVRVPSARACVPRE